MATEKELDEALEKVSVMKQVEENLLFSQHEIVSLKSQVKSLERETAQLTRECAEKERSMLAARASADDSQIIA